VKREVERMSSKNTKLFEPIKIGNIEIKNRVAMAPMGISGLLNSNGSPGQRAIDYYIWKQGDVGVKTTCCIY
jgi:2-enoate reductase